MLYLVDQSDKEKTMVNAVIVAQHATNLELGTNATIHVHGYTIYMSIDDKKFILPVKPDDLIPHYFGTCWTIEHDDKSFTLCNQNSELADILNPIYHDEIEKGDWDKLNDKCWF